MEIRGRRIILTTNAPLPSLTNIAILEKVRSNAVVMLADDGGCRSLQPKIIPLFNRQLTSAGLLEVCQRQYQQFDDKLPDMVICINLVISTHHKELGVTIYQTNRPEYKDGRVVSGYFTLNHLLDDNLDQLKQDPFRFIATLCDRLPDEIGKGLNKTFRKHYVAEGDSMKPINFSASAS